MTTCKECGQPTPATSVSAGVVEPVAWLSDDGRVITASTKREMPRSVQAPYVHPLGHLSAHPPVEVDGLLQKALEALVALEEAARCVQSGEWHKDSVNPERMAAKDAIAALRQHLSANSKGG